MTDHNREELIEEAATMLRHYGYGHLADGIEAVFEQAHAPTDDELRDAIDHVEGGVDFQDAINPEALRVLIASALRRTAVQEPHDEREALARLLDGHWMTPLGKCACGWVHPQYGSRHLDPLYVRHHIADAILAAGFRCTVQGEPTDAEDTGQPTNHEIRRQP